MQTRPIILRSLLVVATPYMYIYIYMFMYTHYPNILTNSIFSHTTTCMLQCCIYICVYVYIYIYIYICIYTYIYIFRTSSTFNNSKMCVCVYKHINIYIHSLSRNGHDFDLITNLVSPRTSVQSPGNARE